MKKISNNMSVKKSSTLAGQRELLREHSNKINELIEKCDLLETYIKDHNIWHYTEKSYTAQASTGSTWCECRVPMIGCIGSMDDDTCGNCGKKEKPQEVRDCKPIVNKDLRKKLVDLIDENTNLNMEVLDIYGLADKILKLLNK
jgi:hypothetical protein